MGCPFPPSSCRGQGRPQSCLRPGWGSQPTLLELRCKGKVGGTGAGGGVLTPPAHCVLAARHDVFALLVFTRNHLKLDGCVTHSMVSSRENRQGIMRQGAENDNSRDSCSGSTRCPLLLHPPQSQHSPGAPALPFKALVEDLIWRQQPSLAGQLVDPRVLDTDVVKIL